MDTTTRELLEACKGLTGGKILIKREAWREAGYPDLEPEAGAVPDDGRRCRNCEHSDLPEDEGPCLECWAALTSSGWADRPNWTPAP